MPDIPAIAPEIIITMTIFRFTRIPANSAARGLPPIMSIS
jgi:hypothetical protein